MQVNMQVNMQVVSPQISVSEVLWKSAWSKKCGKCQAASLRLLGVHGTPPLTTSVCSPEAQSPRSSSQTHPVLTDEIFVYFYCSYFTYFYVQISFTKLYFKIIVYGLPEKYQKLKFWTQPDPVSFCSQRISVVFEAPA